MSQTALNVLAMAVTLAPIMAQTPKDIERLPKTVYRLSSNLELDRVTIPEASFTVLKAFKRPGGIIVTRSGDCVSHERISLFFPWGSDLDSALDTAIQDGGAWSWSTDNLVANIVPRGNLPDIMNVRIKSFEWNTREHVGAVTGRLFAGDRVREYLAEHSITSGLQVGFGPQKPPRMVGGIPLEPTGEDHSLANSTLLGALNRIVASYGSAVWMYTENHCGGKSEYVVSAH